MCEVLQDYDDVLKFEEETKPIKRKNSTTISILEELKNISTNRIPIPNEIFTTVLSLHSKMKNPIYRGNKRKLYIFYLIHQSFLKHQQTLDKFELAKKIYDLSEKEVRKCSREFSELNTGHRPFDEESSVLIFVDKFLKCLFPQEEEYLSRSPSPRQIFEEVSKKDSRILQENPITLACGFVSYFLKITRLDQKIDIQKLSSITKKSAATIKNMEKKVEEIYNEI